MKNNWTAKKLGEVTDIYGGGTPRRSVPEYWGNDVPWLTMEDTHSLNVMGTVQYISNQGLQNSNAQLVPAGSVNLSCTASVGNVTINRIPLATNQQFNSFHPHDELLPEFLAYELMYRKNEIKNLGGTTTIPFITKTSISNFQINVPTIDAQKKIAMILSSVDEVIQKTDLIIRKSEELKSGLMNELLTKGIGHKKFKKTKLGEFSEDWEIVEMNQITHNITDGKHGDCRNETDSGYYFISVKDIHDGQIDYKNARQITKVDFEDTHKRTKLEAGDLLLTNSGTIGRMAVIPDLEITTRTTFQKSVAIIKPDTYKVNVYYMMYALAMVLRSLKIASSGSAQVNLLLKDLRSYKIPLPSLNEQKQIADVMTQCDFKIAHEKEHKNKLTILKSGLMNDIFNQKVQIH